MLEFDIEKSIDLIGLINLTGFNFEVNNIF